jgi:hypothetical protein
MDSEHGGVEKSREQENTSSSKKLKKEMTKAIREANHVKGNVTNLVRMNVASTLKAKGLESGEIKQVVKDVIEGALGAAEEMEIGLATTSRNVARGLIVGINDAGGDIALAAGYAIKYVIREASSFKGDIGQVAIATYDGVVEAIAEVGGNLEATARALIAGAIESASAIGKKNGKKIHVTDFLQEHMCRSNPEVCE